MASILVVDSDAPSRLAVAGELRERGHEVTETDTGGAAIDALETLRPDLVVLDSSLTDRSGLAVLTGIKQNDQGIPTRVVLTAEAGDPQRIVEAFDCGADDFLARPFDMIELVARVGACLRRSPSAQVQDRIRAGGITVDSIGHRVFVDGQRASLAPREYRLLVFFVSNQERVFTRRQLLRHVWERDENVGARTVDVHVRRLRGLLEPFGYDNYLQTVRGSGYRFSPVI